MFALRIKFETGKFKQFGFQISLRVLLSLHEKHVLRKRNIDQDKICVVFEMNNTEPVHFTLIINYQLDL